jgi:hypothetical protein
MRLLDGTTVWSRAAKKSVKARRSSEVFTGAAGYRWAAAGPDGLW